MGWGTNGAGDVFVGNFSDGVGQVLKKRGAIISRKTDLSTYGMNGTDLKCYISVPEAHPVARHFQSDQ